MMFLLSDDKITNLGMKILLRGGSYLDLKVNVN